MEIMEPRFFLFIENTERIILNQHTNSTALEHGISSNSETSNVTFLIV